MLEEYTRASKVVIVGLFIVALGALVFVALTAGGWLGRKAPGTTLTFPVPAIPMTEVQRRYQAIQDQVNAGTLSSEEAKKQMDALAAEMAAPVSSP